MIDWSNSDFDERLSVWKNFRETLKTLETEEEKLKRVAEFFSRVPYGKRTVDFYTPESWPTPWELLDRDNHCMNTISIMMRNTLKFVGVEATLTLINDGQEDYIVPIVGDKILNFIHGDVGVLTECQDIKILQVIN